MSGRPRLTSGPLDAVLAVVAGYLSYKHVTRGGLWSVAWAIVFWLFVAAFLAFFVYVLVTAGPTCSLGSCGRGTLTTSTRDR